MCAIYQMEILQSFFFKKTLPARSLARSFRRKEWGSCFFLAFPWDCYERKKEVVIFCCLCVPSSHLLILDCSSLCVWYLSPDSSFSLLFTPLLTLDHHYTSPRIYPNRSPEPEPETRVALYCGFRKNIIGRGSRQVDFGSSWVQCSRKPSKMFGQLSDRRTGVVVGVSWKVFLS